MIPEIDLQVRTAQAWDNAGVVDAMTAALTRSTLIWWLHPIPANRLQSIRDHLRHLASQTTIRVIQHNNEIIAGAAWICCAHGEQPPAGLVVPGNSPNPRRATQLRTQLSDAHPAQPHRHLLLLGVRPGHQRRGLGTSLLADTVTSQQPPLPRYADLPDNLATAAIRAGYHTAGPPIPVTRDVVLQPVLGSSTAN